jgi:hypothetical protein
MQFLRKRNSEACYATGRAFISKSVSVSLSFKLKFQNQCKKIVKEARAEINKKAGIDNEATPKRIKPENSLLLTSIASSSALTIPKVQKFGIDNFMDRIDSDEQNQLDVLLTRVNNYF